MIAGNRTTALGLAPMVGLTLLGCGQASPSGPQAISGAVISDQVHGGGTQGFFFLPPLVPRPGQFGEQVLGLWPTVTIDQIDPQSGTSIQPIGTFTRTDGPFGERLRRHLANGPQVDDDGDTDPEGYFVARWKTALVDAPAGSRFRIRVLAEGHEMGMADVQVVGTKKELKNVDREELVGLLADHTLRIKFRIESRAVDRDGDRVFDWIDNCPTVSNPNQADSVGNGVGNACRCVEGTDACPRSSRLFALGTSDLSGAPSPASIEVVDLATMAHVHSFDLGPRIVNGLAVSSDGRRAYVADSNGEVAIYDTVSGAQVGGVAVPGAFDLALSPDDTRLYVGAFGAVVAIDTAAEAVIATYPFAQEGTTALSVALAPDGHRLGVVSTTGGSNPTYFSFDVSAGLSPLATVPITRDGDGCDAFPNDSVFAAGGRALLWDSNCDSIYQVDVAAGTQLTAATIDTGRDLGSSYDANNALVYLSTSGRALAMKESNQVLSVDPSAGSFTSVASFVDTPFTLAAAGPDGPIYVSIVHLSGSPEADSLDRIDASATPAVERSVYSFSKPGQTVRAMVVVP